MWRSENTVRRITAVIAGKFPTFGGGQKDPYNPLVNATSDRPFAFAAMVDVRDVVAAVLTAIDENEIEAAHDAQKKPTRKARRR